MYLNLQEKKKVRDFYFGYPISKAPPPVMVEQEEKKKGTENPEGCDNENWNMFDAIDNNPA